MMKKISICLLGLFFTLQFFGMSMAMAQITQMPSCHGGNGQKTMICCNVDKYLVSSASIEKPEKSSQNIPENTENFFLSEPYTQKNSQKFQEKIFAPPGYISYKKIIVMGV